MTSARRSRPPRSLPTPCQAGRKRARAAGSTGSISRRRRASERRRMSRRTSGSHHSRSTPPGRNSPRRSTPAAMSRSRAPSTTPRGSCQRRRRRIGEEGSVAAGPARQERMRARPSWRTRKCVGDARWAGRHPRHRDSARRPRGRSSAPRPAMRTRMARRSACERLEPLLRRRVGAASSSVPRTRAATSSADRSPSRRRRSCTASAEPAARVADQRLQLQLELAERVTIEQLAELLRAEQLAQEVTVERQGLGTPIERAAHRPRTCRWRCSRRAATRRRAKRATSPR